MSIGSNTTWVGNKPLRRVGGMSDALSIAADLGFSVAPPPSQEDIQIMSNGSGEKGDDLVIILRELIAVQRKIVDMQVELQGRKEDKNVAHLAHVSEMEKKIDTLARITTILKVVIQNKDRIIARLRQPYSLDCIPVEAEYQRELEWTEGFEGKLEEVVGYKIIIDFESPITISKIDRVVCIVSGTTEAKMAFSMALEGSSGVDPSLPNIMSPEIRRFTVKRERE